MLPECQSLLAPTGFSVEITPTTHTLSVRNSLIAPDPENGLRDRGIAKAGFLLLVLQERVSGGAGTPGRVQPAFYSLELKVPPRVG